MPELYTKRLWGGDAMNCGDWKMYLAFDSFIYFKLMYICDNQLVIAIFGLN